MLNKLNSLGKYVDQPLLVSKFHNSIPKILIGTAVLYGLHDTFEAKKEIRTKRFIKNTSVLTFTVLSALVARNGLKIKGKEILKKLIDVEKIPAIKEYQSRIIDKFITGNPDLSKETLVILKKAKNKELNPSEINHLFKEFKDGTEKKEFLNKLIPLPEELSARKIFDEIKDLSLLGLIPVIGGVAGGTAGDVLTENDWEKRFPNKVKEGFYQFFANIFLCNVGAGAALFAMEKMNIKSTAARAAGMLGGILATGVIGGSAIANFIGNKFVNPMCDNGFKNAFNGKGRNRAKINDLYSERKPEALDVAMHIDDIATVGVLSGLRWIAPALPAMYAISGYRAGTGYRNNKRNPKSTMSYLK